jgi:hypothetical protein
MPASTDGSSARGEATSIATGWSMSGHGKPPRIALLAIPDASASVIHGMDDLFAGAGRDWSLITTGRPSEPLLKPEIVATTAGDVPVLNGLVVQAPASIGQCDTPAVDAGYFGRLFRREVGLTPVAYRKRFRGLRLSLSRTA